MKPYVDVNVSMTTQVNNVGLKNLNVFSLIVVGAVVLIVLIILTRILEKALVPASEDTANNIKPKESFTLHTNVLNANNMSAINTAGNASNPGTVASQIAGQMPFLTNSVNGKLGGPLSGQLGPNQLFNHQQQLLQAGMNPLMFQQNGLFGLPGMMSGMPGLGNMGVMGLGNVNMMSNQASINQIKSDNATAAAIAAGGLAGFPAPRLANFGEQIPEGGDENSMKRKKMAKKSKLMKLKKLEMVLHKAIKPHAARITRANRQHGAIRGDPKLLSNEKNTDRFIRKIIVLVKNEYRGSLMKTEGRKVPNAYLREPDDRLDELIEKGAIIIEKFVKRYDELDVEDISLNSLNSDDSEDDYSMSDSYSMSTADVGIRFQDDAGKQPIGLIVPVLPRRDGPAKGVVGLAVPVLPRRPDNSANDPKPPTPTTGDDADPLAMLNTANIFEMGMNFLSIGEQTRSEVVPPASQGRQGECLAATHENTKVPKKGGELPATPASKLTPVNALPKAKEAAGGAKNANLMKSLPPIPTGEVATKAFGKAGTGKPVISASAPAAPRRGAKTTNEQATPNKMKPHISDSEKLIIEALKQAEETRLNELESERIIDEFHRLNPEVIVFLEKCLKNSKNALKLQDDGKLKKSIDRDDIGQIAGNSKPKKKMKRGHKANELSNELVLSEICYDDTFMQEVSINIIPPSSTELAIDTEEDDFIRRKPKNRLLPKKMKGRKR